MTNPILFLLNPATGARFEFAGNEVPEHIAYGGTQTLAVHELIGGGRLVDVLGPQPKDMEWSGWFLGAGAFARAQQLDALREAGTPLILCLHKLNYAVLIQSFTADFQLQYKIPYSLTLTVTQDNQYAPPVNTPGSATQIGMDAVLMPQLTTVACASTAASLPAQTAVVQQKASALQSVLAGFGSASNAVSGFANMSSSEVNTILTPLSALRQAGQQLLAEVENTAQYVSTLGGVVPNNPVARNAAAISSSINMLNASSQLVQLDAVLGRLGNNVAAVPARSQTVTVSGGNLYTVAQQQYGDATAWTTIAAANGLSDPEITGIMTLKIPPAPDKSGGVLYG